MKKKYIYSILVFAIFAFSKLSLGQVIYQHDYGTAAFTAVNPYTVVPIAIDPNLSGSQWQTSFVSGFNGSAGSTGMALSLTNSGGTPTYSLSFTVASGFNCDITAYSFWRQRSAAGAQNWTLTVNGVTTIGSGTVPTTGASTGTLAVSSAVTGLSGTVNMVLQLGGATSTGTFRLDDFTLYGSVYPTSSCTSPTIQASSYNATAIGNTAATVNWTSGNGSNVLVLARSGAAVNTSPVSGTAYTANANFGFGQQIGSGNFVVYNGPGTSVNVTGLSPATNYYFSVFEYTTTVGSPCYLLPGLTGSLTTTGSATKLQIKGILVDACNGSGVSLASEPYNEMVNFRTGSGALPISQISIAGKGNTGGFNANKWPNAVQFWHGLVKNTNTASKVSSLNASITGCGYIKEPVAGIIPANQEVIMVTSQYISTTLNSFANLNDTIYMVFQDTVTDATAGHFANYSATPGLRSLIIYDNANNFSDTVTYDVSLLTNISGGNGDAVDYSDDGVASYINRGCQAPFIPLHVTVGTSTAVCVNSPQTLVATPSGAYTTALWSLGAGATGTLSSVNTLTTTYTPGVGDLSTVSIKCDIARICGTKTITAQGTVTLTIHQLPTANLSATNGYSLCPSATTVLSYSITNPTFASTVTPSWSSPVGSGTTYTVTAPSGTAAVTYSLNLTNSCGVTTKTFTVYPLALPTVSLSSTTPTACVGSTLSLSANGNTGNYNWNNSGSSSNATYTLTASTTATGVVTSTNSCGSISDNYTLTVTQNPIVNVNNPSVSLCAGQSAIVTATSSAGTYTWSPDAVNTNSIVVNAAGTHTVSTRNACSMASATVNVAVNPVATVGISTTSLSLCSGGQVTAVLTATGSVGTYTWSTAAPTNTNSSILINTPGTYSVTLDAGFCGIVSNTITIGTLPTPTISVVATSTLLCNGATATLTANSNLTNFSWNNTGNSTNTPTIVVNSTKNYSVQVSNACGSPVANINILADVTPTLNLVSNTPTLCPAQSATLTVTGGSQPYTWSSSLSTSSVIAITSGSTSVSYTNVCGNDTKTISVSVIPSPTIAITTHSFSACPGDMINVVANSSESNYAWSGSANTTATLMVSASTSTTGTVTVTNVCNVSATDTYSINVIPAPVLTASASALSLCTGQSATLTATSSTSTYTWMPGNSHSNTLVVNTANDYTVYTSNACFIDSASVNIAVSSSPVLTMTSSAQSLCATGQTATLSLSGTAGTYNWSNGSGNVQSTVVNTPGVYSATVTTASCGSASTSFTVNAITTPTISLASSSSLLCDGVSATLTASSNMTNENWSNGSINTNSIVINAAGTYTVGVSNACGSPSTSINIQTSTSPVLILTSSTNTICPNETATLTVTGGSSPYVWSNSNSTGSVVTTTGGSVSVTYSNVCGTDTKSVTVNISNVSALISANPMSGVTPLLVNFTNNSLNATTYTWLFGNGNTANTQTVIAQTYTNAGTYTAYLVASDGVCFDTDSVLITVLNEEPSLIIPNVFTPNGDGKNEIFKVTAINVIEFNCVIFDRWGLQMFSYDDVKAGWDGTVGGKNVPTATYFYIINAKDINGKEIKKQGAFSLFR